MASIISQKELSEQLAFYKNKSQNNQNEINELYELAEKENINFMSFQCAIYIDVQINDFTARALVDTGASQNIIPVSLVNELKINNYVDYSEIGICVGVGTCAIVGRIPYLPIHIGNASYPTCFTVTSRRSEQESELIIGLPFMRFYDVNLNIGKNIMTICGKEIPIKMK